MLNKLKIIVLFITSSVSLIFTTLAFAEDWRYSIIVDAGSTGSRLHLFRYHTTASLPVIEDVPLLYNKTAIPLASFTEDPNTVKLSFDNLFNPVILKLKNENIDPKSVPVSILGTAGMRLVSPKEQQIIYNNLSEYLKKQYPFTSITARSISGKEEGIYDWLDVNYLANNFNNAGSTLGCIDMGGASIEVVFATQENKSVDDTITITINGQRFTIYSKSILGLGQDVARKNIEMTEVSASCYPAGYPLSPNINGHFNFGACKDLYDSKILKNSLTKDDFLAIPNEQKFIAFGSIFYTFNFFTPALTTGQSTPLSRKAMLEDSIKNICTMPWQDLKQQYLAEEYLSNYCANGVYIDGLLFGANGYQLQDSQLYQVSNTLNQHSIDWPLGAILYQLRDK